mgnify:CR=1 FL=1
MPRLSLASIALLVAFAATLGGCSTAYYKTMEMFGEHKRDILVDRVEEARDSQNEAKEQFQSALERFTAVTGFKGGKIEEKYNELRDAFEKSEDRAEAVHDRVEAVDDVAQALFKEWEKELDQYTNASLRASSEQQLRDTRTRYAQLIAAMRKAEARMTPVLNAFRDQVLYLKHNLNARAIASLQTEVNAIESEVARLVAEMEKSIAEADAFIQQMGTDGA